MCHLHLCVDVKIIKVTHTYFYKGIAKYNVSQTKVLNIQDGTGKKKKNILLKRDWKITNT